MKTKQVINKLLNFDLNKELVICHFDQTGEKIIATVFEVETITNNNGCPQLNIYTRKEEQKQ